MRKLFLACAMLAGVTATHAQVSSGPSYHEWEEKNREQSPKATAIQLNEFVAVDMSVKDGIAKFEGVPPVKKPVYAVLTNAEGEYIRQARISPLQNTMNVKRLRHGLYFITVVYRNHSKKAFTLNI